MKVGEVKVFQVIVNIAEIDKKGMREGRFFLVGEDILEIAIPPRIAPNIEAFETANARSATDVVMWIVKRTVV